MSRRGWIGPPNGAGLVAGVIFSLIIIAILYVVLTGRDNMAEYRQPDANSNSSSNQPAQNGSGGTYAEYSEQTFDDAVGQRWLFFYASWCPQCRALEQDIKNKGVADDVTILKVNYDTATALKKKYGVTLQTTVVAVDKNGDEIKKFVAYDDPTLSAVANALDKQ